MSRLKRLLRCCTPSPCNTQQNPVQTCNPVAQHMHTAQQAESMTALQEAALVETEDLQAAAGDDWADIKDDPEALDALAKAISIQRLRERGEIPAHYTGTTTCKHCGTVPIFQGVPERVEGCPWCFNRAAGLPLPKALH